MSMPRVIIECANLLSSLQAHVRHLEQGFWVAVQRDDCATREGMPAWRVEGTQDGDAVADDTDLEWTWPGARERGGPVTRAHTVSRQLRGRRVEWIRRVAQGVARWSRANGRGVPRRWARI